MRDSHCITIVTDDDGANDSYEIEVVIKSENEFDNDDWNFGSVAVLIGIIGFSIIMFSRMRNKESQPKSLPKWNETTNDSVQDVKSWHHEDELWD